jgi:phosphate transport system permease protein
MYLSEFAERGIGNLIRFLADVLTGVPSIIIGVFAYTLIVLRFGFSAFAGGFALAIIMLPILARTTEEMLKLVPFSQREAALGLGVSRWRTTLSVVVPGALPGIITGMLLATARIAGETAPLLFTAFGNPFVNYDPTQPVAALPLQIYRFGISPYEEWHKQAWAASFVLVALVLILSAGARLLLVRRPQQESSNDA